MSHSHGATGSFPSRETLDCRCWRTATLRAGGFRQPVGQYRSPHRGTATTRPETLPVPELALNEYADHTKSSAVTWTYQTDGAGSRSLANPLADMRRIPNWGREIRKGDRVVKWCISGDRDDEVIERADDLIIDRARPRSHLSFGYAIHRCVGARPAERKLQIVCEDLLKRFKGIELMGEPSGAYCGLVRRIEWCARTAHRLRVAVELKGLRHRKEQPLQVHVEGLVKMGLSGYRKRCDPPRAPRLRRECRCDHVSLLRRHKAGPACPSATRRPRPS